MELAEYYGGRRRMPMRMPTHMMGGADLMTLRDGTVVPYESWKQCASSNWADRKIACAKYKKDAPDAPVVPVVSYKNWKDCASSNWAKRKVSCAKYKKEKKPLKYPQLAGLPVAQRMAFLRSLKVKGQKRKYKSGCNALGMSNMKSSELKAMAKQQGIRGYSKMKKAELCALFQAYN
jgi:hypothetical protein